MPGFRRAQLRGSDELFRPTNSGDPIVGEAAPDQPPTPVNVPAAPVAPAKVPGMSNAGPGAIRLNDDELTVLADAVQRLKFPMQKSSGRPSIDEFERLEALRQKLLAGRH